MTLDELLQTVADSSPNDWSKMHLHTLYGWEYGTAGEYPYLRPEQHDVLAVYRPDVDISLACGATVQSDFYEPWIDNFPNPSAASRAVWLRYRGSMVHEWVGVSVDEGRYFLPMPKITKDKSYEISQGDLPIARVLFSVYGSLGVHKVLEDALERAGIAIVD